MTDSTHDELLGGLAADPDAPQAVSAAPEAARSFLVFRLGASWYAVDALSVQEVVPTSRPVPVPGVPSFVHGVVNISGRVITQLDVGALLDQLPLPAAANPDAAGDEHPRCLVLQAKGLPFALVSEQVEGMVELPLSRLEGVAQASPLTPERFVLEEKVVGVLDVPAVLAKAQDSIGGR